MPNKNSLARQAVLCGVGASLLIYAPTAEAGDSESSGPSPSANTITSTALVNQSMDLSHNWLEGDSMDAEAAEANTSDASPTDFQIMAGIGYGSMRTDTENGHVQANNWGMDIGAVRTLPQSGGSLTFAPVIDYGKSDYDVHDDANGLGKLGHGKSNYLAGGMMARRSYDSGFYYEGSFRYGRTQYDYTSEWANASYDESANCWAGHLRLGRIYALGRKNRMEVYANYAHTHQDGMDVHFSGGMGDYKIDSSDSGKLRIGTKLTRRVGKSQLFYTELAFQYDHNDNPSVTNAWLDQKRDNNDGISGMLGLGWQVKPVKTSPWVVDINATGWVGMHRGFTCAAKIKKSF